MNIKNRLIQITIMVVAFSIFLMFGLYQIAKGARFHELNGLHLKYVIELRYKITQSKKNQYFDINSIIKTVENIREQPIACLELINIFDKSVMKLINTDKAIELCQNDLNTANKLLEKLEYYRHSHKTSMENMETLLNTANQEFLDNSNNFMKPVVDTVDFIVASTSVIFVIITSIMISGIVIITRNIARSVKMMEETSKALEQSERRNRQLAHYDSLTALPNRNLFLNRLEHQLHLSRRNNAKLALLFIDLDRFKHVNDSMGHQAGDELIVQSGNRLQECIRSSDTVARIGGDEFNIILTEVADFENSIIRVCERIIKVLSESFEIRGKQIFISASIGVAVFPVDADNSSDLRKYADLAMYHAKENGRNNYELYSEHLDEKLKARVLMETNLRKAVDNDEFVLHYQPVVRLEDMKIVGAEALIRWCHPELGMISPMDFIPVAEETGLILEIGEWVIREACRVSKKWNQQTDSEFRVAINVSPRQLKSNKLVSCIQSALQEFDLPAHYLDVEITENEMIEEDGISMNNLHALSELGIRLLLDDFGTGHSSLSYLHKLPFDVLKVDRSFIFKLSEHESARELTTSIIAMAHALNLEVVAEGLETKESLELLKTMKCEYTQGYLLSKPILEEEIDCRKTYQV